MAPVNVQVASRDARKHEYKRHSEQRLGQKRDAPAREEVAKTLVVPRGRLKCMWPTGNHKESRLWVSNTVYKQTSVP